MIYNVNTGSQVPLYKQLVEQIVEAIAFGHLLEDEKLPSLRKLSMDLSISYLTVKQAYDELERRGLIRLEKGRGAFIQKVSDNRQDILREHAENFISTARKAGLSLQEVNDLINKTWES